MLFFVSGIIDMTSRRTGSKIEVAVNSVPLAIPELLPDLNRMVFAYYGNLEHMFFAGDTNVANFVVSLYYSGMRILKITLALWAYQETLPSQPITPNAHLTMMATIACARFATKHPSFKKQCQKQKLAKQILF